MGRTWTYACAAAVTALAACGGSKTPECDLSLDTCGRDVTIAWTANRESGVNGPGGGYRVSVDAQPAVDVPYVSGALAPTSVDLRLRRGSSHTVTVRAYARLDAQGGSGGTVSPPSQSLLLVVP